MKKLIMAGITIFGLTLSGLIIPGKLSAQKESHEGSMAACKEAKSAFLKADPSMENLFRHSYGYAIFPNVGKGAAGIGGAAGRGTVYEKGIPVGTSQMIQVTVGAQAGGEAYREVIFFENKESLQRFMHNKVEFSAETSAIAAKLGGSANVNYREGVVVFTQEKGGLMLDVSLGGQKFKYKPLK